MSTHDDLSEYELSVTGEGCQSGETSIGQDGCNPGETCCCKSDLAGYWKFNESSGINVADDSPYENNGKLGDGTCSPGSGECPNWETSDCISGSCLDFDGSNDYVSIQNDDSLNPPNAITITAWIKVADPNQDRFMRIISKKSAWDSNNGYEFEYNPYNNYLTVLGSGSNYGRAANIDLDTDWHHVAAVIDGTIARVYVDGVDRTTDPSVSGLASGTEDLHIGKLSGGTYYFNGIIDEVKIWNRALTEDEISEESEPPTVKTTTTTTIRTNELGCMMGSRGCIVACQRTGYAFGVCEIDDKRCRWNECYCYCAGVGTRVFLGLTTYDVVIILLVLVLVIVIVYGGFKYFTKKT